MTVVATRVVETALGPMRVELDAPVPDGPDSVCVYRISGPATNRTGRAMGVDGFQALQLAMERIGADLRASEEFEAGPLRWLGMPGPGFPLPEPMRGMGWDRPGPPT